MVPGSKEVSHEIAKDKEDSHRGYPGEYARFNLLLLL
jgi:hypothetical protein